MRTQITVFFTLLLLIGCKKDEPGSVPKIGESSQPSKQEEPKSVSPKTEPPKKEVDPRVKLGTLDLRPHGIPGVIDAPAGAKIARSNKGNDLTIDGSDGFALILSPGTVDLATEYEDIKTREGDRLKSAPVKDKDALIVEIEEDGHKHYPMFANVMLAGNPYVFASVNDQATLPQVQRNLQAARSLRQTPEIKAAEERSAIAMKQLSRVPDRLTPLKPGGYRIRINGSTPGYEEDLKAVVALTDTVELELIDTDKFTDEHIQTLIALPRLRVLKLHGKWVNRRVLSALPEFTKLSQLGIEHAPVDDVALRSLTALADLQALSLSRTRVSDNGVKVLSELKNLQHLDLTGTNVTSAGLTHFKLFKNLQTLHLDDTAVSDANLNEVAAVPTLQALNLAMTAIGDKGIEVFGNFASPLTLHLNGSDVTLDGIAKLKKANDKITIDTRWLEEPEPKAVTPPVAIDKLPPADVAALVAKFNGKITRDETAADKPIVGIDLSNSKVTDTDLGHLRTSSKLLKLTLAGCSEITDAGLPYLAGLTTLEQIDLRGTRVKGDGLAHLKTLTDLTHLLLPLDAQFTARQLAPVSTLPSLEVLSFKLPGAENVLPLRTLAKVANLKEVDFTGVALTNRHLEHLKNSKQLETLILSRQEQLTDRGLSHLKGLEKLKTLVIPAYSGTNFGLEHLRGLSNLKIFELYGVNITDAGMPAVGALHNLERLRLDRLNIGDDGVRSLRNFGKLIELGVGNTRVTDKGLDAIADNKEIEYIDLSYTKVTDAGLAKLQNLEELRGVRLDGTTINGKGFETLAKLPRINRVSLQDTKFDDAGAEALTAVSRLRSINLNGNAITKATIAELKQLRQLEELDLDRCDKLTDDAVAILKTYPSLKRVSLKGTKLSSKAIDELRTSGVTAVAN